MNDAPFLLRHPLVFLLWSALTLIAYFACRWVFVRTRLPLLHPGFTGIVVMVLILECTGRRYDEFKRSTEWINWLLRTRGRRHGRAHLPTAPDRARQCRPRSGWSSPLGMTFAVATTVGLLAAFGRARPIVAAGALKSITSPVAYRLAVDTHTPVDATLAGVLIAGMLGATVGPTMLGWLRVRDHRAVGLALGCSAHGIGARARGWKSGKTAGAFASIAMSMTAMLGSLVLPYLLRWILSGG